MTGKNLAVFVLIVALIGACGSRSHSPETTEVPRFEPAPCPVPAPRGVECGYLIVPEDRSQPEPTASSLGEAKAPSDGAPVTIRLAVAILKSHNDNPAPDPVVFLTGGPGASAVEPLNAWRDNALRENRDVILFEQRGTMHSEPWLDCPEVEDVLTENLALALSAEEEVNREVEAALECRDRLLAEGVNLAAYNSAASAADLEDLRRVLGYDEWNLYGVSYGTRLALTTMRDYPEGIRSVVFNSPFPPVADTYVEMVDIAAGAFHALFADCEADPVCRTAYPNLEENFYHGLEQINAYPIPVSIRVPPGEVQLTAKDLIAGMYTLLRGHEANALLPFIVSQIYQENQEVLVPMVESGLPSFSGLSRGMLHSVECYEEAPFNPPEAIQAASQSRPILLDYLPIHFNLAICEIWPSGQAGPLETEPVHSDIPTLLLAGEYDPYTPPSWAERAAATLSNSYVYVFPGIGHGPVVHSKCARNIMLEFIDDPTIEPDAACLAEIDDLNFVTPDDLYLTPAVYQLNADLYVAPNPLRLGLLALCLLVFVGEIVSLPVRWLRARRQRAAGRIASLPPSPPRALARGLAVAVATLNLAFFAALVWIVFDTYWMILAFGVPTGAGWIFWLPRLAAVLTLSLPVLTIVVWRRRYWTQARRVYYTLFTLAALVFLGLLLYWQMLALPS